MNFYRRFPGDYLRDTQHLTNSQHGIYCRLLDTLYSTERPIRTIEDAYRIAGCLGDAPSMDDCAMVVREFFIWTDGGIWHPRVEKELKYAESRRLKADVAAKARWSKNAPSNAPSNAPAMRVPDSRLQRARRTSCAAPPPASLGSEAPPQGGGPPKSSEPMRLRRRQPSQRELEVLREIYVGTGPQIREGSIVPCKRTSGANAGVSQVKNNAGEPN